jgi:diacylglycerol kinase family enzyme
MVNLFMYVKFNCFSVSGLTATRVESHQQDGSGRGHFLVHPVQNQGSKARFKIKIKVAQKLRNQRFIIVRTIRASVT